MDVARLDDDKPVSDMRKQRGGEGRGAIGRVGRGRAGLIVLGGVLCVGMQLEGCSGGAKPQSADRGGGAPDTSTVAGPGSAAGESPLPPGSSVDMGRVAEAGPVRVLFIGTSLTAGFGLPDAGQAWPSQLGHIADSLGYQVVIQNAGLSGETSAGALRRTDWLLKDPADVVVIETGANDGLRGTSVPQLEANLTAIVGKVRTRMPKAEVVVVQMEAPPNLGAGYAGAFHAVFPKVAKATGATLTPFLLDKVAGVAALNQADGIHPTAEGAGIAARNLWPVIRGVLDRKRVRPAA